MGKETHHGHARGGGWKRVNAVATAYMRAGVQRAQKRVRIYFEAHDQLLHAMTERTNE